MRTDFEFAPLYRATVGFDRVFDMLDSMAGQPAHGGYPPYNIEKTADDAWRIVMAVAGFTEADVLDPTIGSSDPAEFSVELWTVVALDRVNWIERVSAAVVKAITDHIEGRKEAGNA